MVQQPPPAQLSLPCAAFQLPACAVCTLQPRSVGCYHSHGCSKQVHLGMGLAGSAARCSGQPKVGFVQGTLGLMLSRHVTLNQKATIPVQDHISIPPLYYHAVGEDAVHPTSFCSLGGADGEVTRPPHVFRSGFPVWMCCATCHELQSCGARDVFEGRGCGARRQH